MAKTLKANEPITLAPEVQQHMYQLSLECDGDEQSILDLTEKLVEVRKEEKNLMKKESELKHALDHKRKQIQVLAGGGHIEDLFTGVPAAKADTTPHGTLDGMTIVNVFHGSKIPAATVAALEKQGFKSGKDVRLWVAEPKPRAIEGISPNMRRQIQRYIEQWLQDRITVAGETKRPSQPHDTLKPPGPKQSAAADKPEPTEDQKKLVDDGLNEIKNRGKKFTDEINDALDTRLKLADLPANGVHRKKLLDFLKTADDPSFAEMVPAQFKALVARINGVSKHAMLKIFKAEGNA